MSRRKQARPIKVHDDDDDDDDDDHKKNDDPDHNNVTNNNNNNNNNTDDENDNENCSKTDTETNFTDCNENNNYGDEHEDADDDDDDEDDDDDDEDDIEVDDADADGDDEADDDEEDVNDIDSEMDVNDNENRIKLSDNNCDNNTTSDRKSILIDENLTNIQIKDVSNYESENQTITKNSSSDFISCKNNNEKLEKSLENSTIVSNIIPTTNHHVNLGSIEHTRLAAAQFAATAALANGVNETTAIKDIIALQSTLFTLQEHQQIFQMQLIRHLQSQLFYDTSKLEHNNVIEVKNDTQHPNESLKNDSNQSNLVNVKLDNKSLQSNNIRSKSIDNVTEISSNTIRTCSPQSSPQRQDQINKIIPSDYTNISSEPQQLSLSKIPNEYPPQIPSPMRAPMCHISSTLASTIITDHDRPSSMDEPNSLEMLQKRAQEVLETASQGLLSGNLVDELTFRQEKFSGFPDGRKESEFKHRCKYCGKVFGSDSALQIHIRSHTGERPFKCHVCNSSFTTKGNLKVHFTRHTQRFPQFPPFHPIRHHPAYQHYQHHQLPPDHHLLLPQQSSYDDLHRNFNKSPEQNIIVVTTDSSNTKTTNTPVVPPPPINTNNLSSTPTTTFNSLPPRLPIFRTDVFPQNTVLNILQQNNSNSTSDRNLDIPADLSKSTTNTSTTSTISTTTTTTAATISITKNPENIKPKKNLIETEKQIKNSNVILEIDKNIQEFPENLTKSKQNLTHSYESTINAVTTSDTSKLQVLVDNIENSMNVSNECQICHKILPCKNSLNLHYRMHTGERSIKFQQQMLLNEQNVNDPKRQSTMTDDEISGEDENSKFYKCPICQKIYKNTFKLQQHIQDHISNVNTIDLTNKNSSDAGEKMLQISNDKIRNTEETRNLRNVKVHDEKRNLVEQLVQKDSGSEVEEDDVSNDEYNISIGSRRKKIKYFHQNGSIHSPPPPPPSSDDNQMNDHRPKSTDSSSPKTMPYLNTTQMIGQQQHVQPDSSMRVYPNILFTPNSDHGSPSSLPSILPNNPFSHMTNMSGLLSGNVIIDHGYHYMNELLPGIRGNTTCNICFKTFACHSALEIHYRSHTKERPFKCTICDRGFSTKGNMKQHMLTHKIRDMPQHMFGNSMQSPPQSSDSGHSFTSTLNNNHNNSNINNIHNLKCESPKYYELENSDDQQQLTDSQQMMESHNNATMLMMPISMKRSVSETEDDHPLIHMPKRSLIVTSPYEQSSSKSPISPKSTDNLSIQHPPPPPSSVSEMSEDKEFLSISPVGKIINDSVSTVSLTPLTPPPPPPQLQSPLPTPLISPRKTSSPLQQPILSTKSVIPIQIPESSSTNISTSKSPSITNIPATSPTESNDPNNNKHLCFVCRKNFSSTSALQIHMRTHTGIKPFTCTICKKSFTTKGNLKVHMGTHMWSTSASRRGRRMSLELPINRPIPLNSHDADFLQRRPDLFYHYLPAPPPPPFLNGMHQKFNDINCIPLVNKNMSGRYTSTDLNQLVQQHQQHYPQQQSEQQQHHHHHHHPHQQHSSDKRCQSEGSSISVALHQQQQLNLLQFGSYYKPSDKRSQSESPVSVAQSLILPPSTHSNLDYHQISSPTIRLPSIWNLRAYKENKNNLDATTSNDQNDNRNALNNVKLINGQQGRGEGLAA